MITKEHSLYVDDYNWVENLIVWCVFKIEIACIFAWLIR